jgi:hypothetical protein
MFSASKAEEWVKEQALTAGEVGGENKGALVPKT